MHDILNFSPNLGGIASNDQGTTIICLHCVAFGMC